MKQPDYTSIAPRGQVQQPQQPYPNSQPVYGQPYPQQGYVQPGYQPQPMPTQYQQGYPQYQQAGYQPPQQPQQPINGTFVPTQVNIGEGSQEFRDAYQSNLNKFNEVNRRVKEGINQSEAVKRVKEMSSYKTKVEADWNDSVQGAAINPEMMLNYIENLCVSLQNPQEWLPATREKYFKPFRERSADIVAALKSTANTIRKLAGIPIPDAVAKPSEG